MFSLFESKKDKKFKQHLRNLVFLAKVDGKLNEVERDLIFRIGLKYGLKDYFIAELIEEIPDFDFRLPASDYERFDQIYDLVQLMVSDGIVDDHELDFCVDMAERLGFRKAVVGVLVRKISQGVSNGQNKDLIRKEAEAFLTN
ncbi:MAG: TerB family tellurite resistance protein [Sporocytophaga sp.]|uniref:tellurite resistance TerB family protein n=1 Tax=Sporocytophaga sp. TaxID=2231183 RepID=UPI001B26554B|nr:TerB family tellurite resistance protein [Sporocytophaga sp.]MBO9701083.1 TerB family tellurite resistance protein [Sporocytophaga sp.]